ncbi:hypothetical protein GQ53DRAFT_743240 [Thozetella sp. PMI_491]|nr:hypothetical protein GQ53DRAFT_743240 [Thozetella sp. PMI_491]
MKYKNNPVSQPSLLRDGGRSIIKLTAVVLINACPPARPFVILTGSCHDYFLWCLRLTLPSEPKWNPWLLAAGGAALLHTIYWSQISVRGSGLNTSATDQNTVYRWTVLLWLWARSLTWLASGLRAYVAGTLQNKWNMYGNANKWDCSLSNQLLGSECNIYAYAIFRVV